MSGQTWPFSFSFSFSFYFCFPFLRFLLIWSFDLLNCQHWANFLVDSFCLVCLFWFLPSTGNEVFAWFERPTRAKAFSMLMMIDWKLFHVQFTCRSRIVFQFNLCPIIESSNAWIELCLWSYVELSYNFGHFVIKQLFKWESKIDDSMFSLSLLWSNWTLERACSRQQIHCLLPGAKFVITNVVSSSTPSSRLELLSAELAFSAPSETLRQATQQLVALFKAILIWFGCPERSLVGLVAVFVMSSSRSLGSSVECLVLSVESEQQDVVSAN